MINSFIDGLGDLAASIAIPAGQPNQALASFTQCIVNVISNTGFDLMMDFAMRQLGLGNIRQNIQRVLQFIPNTVDTMMRRAVSAIVNSITSALPNGGSTGLYAGMIGSVRPISYGGQTYSMWVAKPRTGNPQVKISQGGNLVAVLTPSMFNETISAGSRGRLGTVIDRARDVALETTPA